MGVFDTIAGDNPTLAEMEEGVDVDAEVEEAIDRHIRGAINDREFRIIVPKEDNRGNRISSAVIEEIVHRVSDRFGGATVYPTTAGCWVSDDDELICDENAVIVTTRDSDDDVPFEADREWFQRLASRVADNLGQLAVMVSEDVTEARFIEGKFRPSVPRDLRTTGDVPDERGDDDTFRRLL